MTDDARWRTTMIGADATVQEAIRNLDASALQIALVVGADGVLLGTLTDGDIRRGLLRGFDLGSPVMPIIRRDPVVVPPEIHRDTVLQLMQANGFNAVPVVNEARQVVGLHILNELLAPPRRDNLMVIMAGGRGARLHPHTERCPKPLLPVGGKPMLEHIIERARADGFHRFVLAVHYLGHMIEEYFGDGGRWHVGIDYVREDRPLGTAGAIGLIEPRADTAIVVSNGDVLTDIRFGDLLDYHGRHDALATMAVRQHEWQHPFGVVRTNGVEIIGFEEKPISRSYINAGVYVLAPEAVGALAPGEPCDMPTLFTRLQERGEKTIVYPVHEPWIDAGDVKDLERVRARHSGGGRISEKASL
jgi:dTDP-glucose pyrophosphorylase